MLACSCVLGMQTCLACLFMVYMFSMLACFVSLCAHMFYKLVCSFDIVCPIFFAFEKLTSKNSYIEKFLFIQRSI